MVADDLPTGRRLWERAGCPARTVRWAAGPWLFIVSLEQQIAAISRDDGRVAWVTQLPQWENPEKQQRSDHLVRAVAGGRPAGGGGDQ